MAPEKCGDLSWFKLEYLPDNIISHVIKAIQNTLRGKVYSEFGWAWQEQQ